MRTVARWVKGVALWLEHRFPERMTTDEVVGKFVEYERRLAFLESQILAVRNETQKLKIFNGIAQMTGLNGE